jgi:hypothetical protein
MISPQPAGRIGVRPGDAVRRAEPGIEKALARFCWMPPGSARCRAGRFRRHRECDRDLPGRADTAVRPCYAGHPVAGSAVEPSGSDAGGPRSHAVDVSQGGQQVVKGRNAARMVAGVGLRGHGAVLGEFHDGQHCGVLPDAADADFPG